VHIVYKLLVCIVPYSCMFTQLYNHLLGLKLVNTNENLLRTLDTWQLFAHDHTQASAVLFSRYTYNVLRRQLCSDVII